MADSRRDELELRLRTVQERIGSAAEASGRSRDDIVLVVVTKTWPTSDIRLLHGLGVRNIGENRHQDAEQKVAELADLSLCWHFIGQIQSNKAARIAAYADVVHSVDSVRVAERLGGGAEQDGRSIDCFVQVSLDTQAGRSGRGGVTDEQLDDVAGAVDDAPGLRLLGLMGVAPQQGDARSAYESLVRMSRRLTDHYPAATAISAGMSGDFPLAIRAGATHVRVGSAVLGERTALR